MMRIVQGVMVVLALAGAPTVGGAAPLIGNTILGKYKFPTVNDVYAFGTFTPNPFVVGAGVESTIDVEGVTFIDIDFSANALVITLNTVLSAPT
jgi:hypothetical protein